MKIAFVWMGFDGRYGVWRDGLYAAMKLIEKEHAVRYFDTTRLDELQEWQPDVVLYWEALCTYAGKDRLTYYAVQNLPFKKALLFAGGPIKKEWCEGFDLFFVESKVNEEEFEALGLPWKRAFGVNTQIMKPEKQPKVFDGVFQCTCASWKRPWLMAEALHGKAAVFGRYQETDPIGFMRCREQGTLVLPEMSAEGVCSLINASHTVVNCSDVWGGGQRSTLEAMACGVPVVVMEDSPKNCEYVQESGAGWITRPDPELIRNAVGVLKERPSVHSLLGLKYIQSKFTERHYAGALLEGIAQMK